MVLGGELLVARHEGGRGGRPCQALQVHGEEGHVGEHVAAPQIVVERETVEDPGTVGQTEDVLGEQVAVAVADQATVDPLAKQVAATRDVPEGELADPFEVDGVDVPPGVGAHLVELGAPAGLDDLGRRVPGGVVEGVEPGVHRGDRAGHRPEAVAEVVGVDQRGQATLGGQAAHDDQVVGDRVVLDQVADAEVHVGRESPVELQLPVACPLASRPLDMVEEGGADRLEQLVGPVPREEDRRHVRLGDRGRSSVGHRRWGGRYIITGHGASCRTFMATLPATSRARPVRPWVDRAIIAAPVSAAWVTIDLAGFLPCRTS